MNIVDYCFVKTNEFTKILLIISFMILFVILVILNITPPSSGYEWSIYNMYPWYFWAFFCVSSGLGVLVILIHVFFKKRSSWAFLGIFVVLFSNALFLGLPFFRGYTLYPSGDAITHLGMMKDIIATGYLGKNNFYPIIHIYGITLSYILRISDGTIVNLIFIWWSILYISNIYVLSIAISKIKEQSLLITAFACPLIFSNLHTLIHPSVLSILVIPLLLSLVHKNIIVGSRSEIPILSIILGFFIAFIHPITCIFAISLISAYSFILVIYKSRFSKSSIQGPRFPAINRIGLVMLISFFIWYMSYSFIQGSFRKAIEFIINENLPTTYKDQISIINTAELPLNDIVEVFIYKYGSQFLYLSLCIISVLIIITKVLQNREKIDFVEIVFGVLFILAASFSAYSLFGFTGELGVMRVLRFFLTLSPILIGLTIYYFISNTYYSGSRQMVIFIIITLIIFSAIALNYYNIYGSARVVDTNWQISEMDLAGSKWFLINRDSSIIINGIGIGIQRFNDLFFGVDTRSINNKLLLDHNIIPSHFGYSINNTIDKTFRFQSRYLLISKAGETATNVVPENARSKAHIYGRDDFFKLENDPTITLLYNNGEFKTWRTI